MDEVTGAGADGEVLPTSITAESVGLDAVSLEAWFACDDWFYSFFKQKYHVEKCSLGFG